MSGNSPWWDVDDAGSLVVRTCNDLRSRDEARRTATRVWDDLYRNRSLASRGGADPFGVLGRAGIDVASVNVVRNVCDFVHAKVTAEVPAVRAESHGGDHSEIRRAVNLSRFLAGTFEAGHAPHALSRSTLSCLRTGTGAVKVVVRDGRICYEPTSVRELFVDPDDARHGDPRCLYQIKPTDRHALAAEFPDHADAILGVAGSTDPYVGGLIDPWSLPAPDGSQCVDLFEAWCLPRFGEKGRHVIAIEGQEIHSEEWEAPRFPFAFVLASDPDEGAGFWGQGFIERLVPLQYEINETVAGINKAERMTQLRVFMPDGSDVPDEALEDPGIGNIIPYSPGPGGGVPVFMTPPGVSEQRIEWLRQLIDWAYSQFGMSEQAASSQRPSGINSGRAQLVYHDIQTLRHVDLAKRVGELAVQLAERTLDAAHRLTEDDPGWTARFDGPTGPRSISWNEVDMDREAYVITLEEASPVPDTYAGHVQQVEQDVAEGRIPAEYLMQLRQDPDAEARWDSATADSDFADWIVEELLDERAPMPPVLPDECRVDMLADRLRTEVLRATMSRAKPAVIERLRSYAGDLAEQTQPPAQPQQPGQPGQAPAAGPSPFTGGIAQTTPGGGSA